MVLLVDLPGYGYARAPARVRAEPAGIIERYPTAGRPLALAVMLIDSRHEPSDLDLRMNAWLEAQDLSVRVVSTGIGRLSRQERSGSLKRSRRLLKREDIIPFPGDTGEGKRELWQAIDSQTESLRSRMPASPTAGARETRKW